MKEWERKSILVLSRNAPGYMSALEHAWAGGEPIDALIELLAWMSAYPPIPTKP